MCRHFAEYLKLNHPTVEPTQRWKLLIPDSADRYEKTKNVYQLCFPLPISEVRHVQDVYPVLTIIEKIRRIHPDLSDNKDQLTSIQREFVNCCPVVRGEVQNNIKNNVFGCHICNHGPQEHEQQEVCSLTEKEAYLLAYLSESNECPICFRIIEPT